MLHESLEKSTSHAFFQLGFGLVVEDEQKLEERNVAEVIIDSELAIDRPQNERFEGAYISRERLHGAICGVRH